MDECQGPHDGELSVQEADDLLRGVQTRAARAISHLYAAQPEEQPPAASGSRSAPSVASTGPASAAGPVVTASNAVPVPPLLRRLFRNATGAWLPGLGKLRPQAAQRQQPQAHAAARNASAASSTPSPPAPAAAAACPTSAAAAAAASSGCVLLQRALEDFKAFRFPRQTNKLAFVFDPAELGLSLSFGVEVRLWASGLGAVCAVLHLQMQMRHIVLCRAVSGRNTPFVSPPPGSHGYWFRPWPTPLPPRSRPAPPRSGL